MLFYHFPLKKNKNDFFNFFPVTKEEWNHSGWSALCCEI